MSSFLHFKPLKLRHQSETEVSNWVITVSSASLSPHEGVGRVLIIFNYQVSKTSATLPLFCHFPLLLSVFPSSLLNTVFVSKAEAAGKHVTINHLFSSPLLILSISKHLKHNGLLKQHTYIIVYIIHTYIIIHIYNFNSETQSHTNTKDHQQPHN